MTTTPEQRTRLKAAAEAATDGPWVADNHIINPGDIGDQWAVFEMMEDDPPIIYTSEWQQEENAKFIALANPETILALLAEIEALEARVASAEGALRPFAEDDGMYEVNSDYVAARAHFQSQGGDHGRD